MNYKLFSGRSIGLLTLMVILKFNSFGAIPISVNTCIRTGLWSALNNPAGLAASDHFAVGFYHSRTFLLKELSTSACALSVPVGKSGTFGVGYRQFGYSLYRNQCARLSYAMKLGKSVSAGIGIDYYAIRFGNEYGSALAFTGSAGIQIQITPELKTGVSIYNPQRATLSDVTGDRIPSEIAMAFAWNFGSHAELNVGVLKLSDSKAFLQVGFEYRMSDKFGLMAGLTSGKDAFQFGFDYRIGSVNFHCASGYHVMTGFSPQFSMIFKKQQHE